MAREKELELPVSHFMDASTPKAKVKMEVGFINFIVGPIWAALGQLLPEVSPCVRRISENKASWENMISEESFSKPESRAAPAGEGQD